MVVGVLVVAFALVALTSAVISAVGVGVFFSFLSLSAVFGGLVLYTGNAEPFRKRLFDKSTSVVGSKPPENRAQGCDRRLTA